MNDYGAIGSACLAVLIGICAVRWYTNPLRAIPTVGGLDLPGLSYIGALSMLGDCRDLLEEGYRKYPESAFKIPALDKWIVVVTGRKMVEDVRKRGDDELSGPDGFQETLQSQYTLEPPVALDEYHVAVVQERFTRRLPVILPGVIDEVVVSIKEHIIASENEWSSVEIMPALQKVVARASNRAFVGLPLCRNEEYLTIAVDFSVDLMKASVILRFFPRFLKPLLAALVNPLKHDTHRAIVHIQPVIEERQKAMAELGEGWNDKPNDLLQFLLDKATTRKETPFVIAQRLLAMNFAAIHTTSMTVTHALYHIAEHPELVAPLRDEVETSIGADGWTGAALANMWKLDSLLRETLRFYGVGILSMSRIAMRDVTLADGTRVPQGTMVCAASHAMHHDDAILADAGSFDAFRFARMRGAEGQSVKHQITNTSPEFLPFGHGHHACPGRYFASNELKAILAHIILNYDVKLGGDGSRPPEVYVSFGVIPALRGRVLFKRRERSI